MQAIQKNTRPSGIHRNGSVRISDHSCALILLHILPWYKDFPDSIGLQGPRGCLPGGSIHLCNNASAQVLPFLLPAHLTVYVPENRNKMPGS